MTTQHYDLCLKNGQVMIDGNLISTNVYVTEGKIVQITTKLHDTTREIDCKNIWRICVFFDYINLSILKQLESFCVSE